MGDINWSWVKKEHIIQACQLYDKGERPSHKAKSTYLLYRGKTYDAKFIRGLAYEQATGRRLNPSVDYSGGEATRRFLNKLGFDVKYNEKVYQGETLLAKRDTVSSVQRPIDKTPKPRRRGKDPQKEVLHKLLEQFFGEVCREFGFDWLVVPDIADMDSDIASIFEALRSYRNFDSFSKPGEKLKVDYYIPSRNLIIEYDERQHFTEPRAITLRNYPADIKLGFDKNRWLTESERIQAKDPTPPDRDETRAFYDSLRDILATRHGMTVVRVKYKDYDWTKNNAGEQLDALLQGAIKTEGASPQAPIKEVKDESQKKQKHSGLGHINHETFTVALVMPEVYAPKPDDDDPPPNTKNAPLAFEPIIPQANEFAGEPIDIVVFPEDYIKSDDEDRIHSLHELANELNTHLLVGVSEPHLEYGGTRVTLMLFEPNGNSRILYYKHSTANYVAFEFPDWDPKRYLPIFEIKGVKIGCTICHDSYLGLLQHYLAKNGAEIWINPSYDNVVHEKWRSIFRLRAVENGIVSLCTLHDNCARGDRRAKARLFGFDSNGNELTGYQPGKPFRNLYFSDCTEPGIYIVKCPLKGSERSIIPSELPLTRKRPLKESKGSEENLGVSLINSRPHIENENGWQPLEHEEIINIDGRAIGFGLIHGEELFNTVAFNRVLKNIYDKNENARDVLE